MRGAVATVAVLLLPLTAFPDSLGEAARKEAQRRAQNRAAGVKARTYGDGDVRAHPSEEVGKTAATPDPAASPTTDESRTREELARAEAARRQQEQAWRQRAAAARGWVDAAQRFLNADDRERLKLSGG